MDQGNKYVNLSASALVKTGQGVVTGIVVGSHTGGTIKLWDNTSAATTVLVNTMTLGAAERFVPLYDAQFRTGLYVTIGGTADITVIYQ